MKIYRRTPDPKIIFDESRGRSFAMDHPHDPLATEYNQLISIGQAQLLDASVPSVADRRKGEYANAQLDRDQLLVALWEHVVEGRPDAAQKLQELRVKIKTAIPKEAP